VGGAEELGRSASGLAVLDLDFLEKVLKRYDITNLWAATGWFLERFQKTFQTQCLQEWNAVARGQSNASSAVDVVE
jgi:hypothetical protein